MKALRQTVDLSAAAALTRQLLTFSRLTNSGRPYREPIRSPAPW
jgi:hypothetical protein